MVDHRPVLFLKSFELIVWRFFERFVESEKIKKNQRTFKKKTCLFLVMVSGKWWGPLNNQPHIIYTLYSGYLLGISPFKVKGILGGVKQSQGYHHFPYDGEIFFPKSTVVKDSFGRPNRPLKDVFEPFPIGSHVCYICLCTCIKLKSTKCK